MPYAIDALPEGYRLQVMDDCGAPERQPHVRARGFHTYSETDCNADIKARSVAWHEKRIEAVYENLNPNLTYVLAVTYASETFNRRIQSLAAGPVTLHGPRPLPVGGSERLLFRLPAQAVREGRLTLRFDLEGPVNVVVSAIELWAEAPSPNILYLTDISGLFTDLTGRALDISFEGVSSVPVALRREGAAEEIAATLTAPDGSFRFERKLFEALSKGGLELAARYEGQDIVRRVPASQLYFEPVRYRPAPARIGGMKEATLPLNGVWKIDPAPEENARLRPLADPGWKDIAVPGQWLQQGFDVPMDRAVAMAKEFEVPSEWAGHRIILRFDGIHAGTRYWLNGRLLGYSENLYTPVEWDITESALPGRANRLDLEMKVETVSEKLSFASGYAFHNLGGIDRSVRLFALPPVHVRDLHLNADLDNAYRNGLLALKLTLENSGSQPTDGLSLRLSLYGPDRKRAALSAPAVAVGPLAPGRKTVEVASQIENPLQWSAEKPHLYKLVIDVLENGHLSERIERQVGFRKIEVRGSQLLLNGKAIKLAGACHHETHPLTGRADTSRWAEKDIAMMKGANLNYVRTSHYPPNQELLDCADRLGMYVEVEAPFCWVPAEEDMSYLQEILVPTSAMIDYHHSHPSVIIWSLANESAFNKGFEVSNSLVKSLDPTRPTTFNNPDPRRVCDIANAHYPPMPYDEVMKDDPRPLLLGEYFYPICHEQTDAEINPGLRELWGHGHSDPSTEWARKCALSFEGSFMHPGAAPGAWSHIVRSGRVIGGAIWAALDEPFYLPGGKQAGYAWVHGFWGVLDAWRRQQTKPEWWLSKLIYAPVWFPKRAVPFASGQKSVQVSVENRYSFTDLEEMDIIWRVRGTQGRIKMSLPAGANGELTVPVPAQARPGDMMTLSVINRRKELINTIGLHLGEAVRPPLPVLGSGSPGLREDGSSTFISGNRFRLAMGMAAGQLDASDPAHSSPLLRLPALHLTHFDFGDLIPTAPPYGELPDPATRVVEDVRISRQEGGLEILVKDRYTHFAGTLRWRLDKTGKGKIAYDYLYTGEDLSVREIGIKLALRRECDRLTWKRWSEWDIFPAGHISRTEGSAQARRDPKWGDGPEIPPSWPWQLDQTDRGTADFRSVKFHIYEASLLAPNHTGVRVYADGDAHVRTALAGQETHLHILSDCWLGPVVLKNGSRISGEFTVELKGG
ncbi:MAG: hypothetical protein IT210_17575 [Armatimonadetes bacterium]|nr:hypothetical protein [Armatimonadota bacterium]